ncbi:hypothetical protein D4764_18G0007240 [Takifugu flavidus]|uniref:Interferon-induced protein 44-like n=1 Tax=Takifugu flavidus TaxID=433684 RepID=A0A5C6NT03_9TELE|nr:hypothetical protein D4764_18G0007240 [Takifugu flavidus]
MEGNASPETPEKMRDKLICVIQFDTITLTGDSFLQYKNYRFARQSDPNSHYCVSINDIVGLEESRGVHVDDIILALKGHVRDGYEFNPSSPLKGDEGYNPSPNLQDRVHVLVSVVSADGAVMITDEMVKKMRKIGKAASDMEIPQLTIITKGDKACPAVKDNVENLYKSKYLKEKYKNYRFTRQSDPNNYYCVSINDIVGLEKSRGTHVDDIILALKGHVRDGYEFNPSSPLKEGDEGYNPSPNLQDRVHVLVSVIPADGAVIITDEMVKKMRRSEELQVTWVSLIVVFISDFLFTRGNVIIHDLSNDPDWSDT